LLVLLAVQSSAAFAAGGTWLPGIEATLPANAGANPSVSLTRLSCRSARNCTAVGTYVDSSGDTQGLLLTESSSVRGAGVEAVLPAGAGANPFVSLNDVSCASAGNCTAVGGYVDSSGDDQGLLLTETSGAWATGVEATLPPNAGANPLVSLTSVSCPSAGNCTAVGTYTDSSGTVEGVRLDETSGTWANGVVPALPANAKSPADDSLSSVSCPSAGNCTAVGFYFDSSANQQAELWSESAGTWAATGTEGVLPANARTNPVVSLASVSCASAGNCSVVGYYFDSSVNQQGLLLTESSRAWATGVEASLPADAAANPLTAPTSVSCGAAGGCSAVGYYFDSSNHFHAVQLDQSAGTWASGTDAALPANANSRLIGDLRSVSCPSSGNCDAVGNYFDSSGLFQGLLLSESSGTWGTGIEATLPAGAGPNPDVVLTSVSCASAGNCAAVGTYSDSSGNRQGLLLDDPTCCQSTVDSGPPPLPEQGTPPAQQLPSAATLAVQAALPIAPAPATHQASRRVNRTVRGQCARSSRRSRHRHGCRVARHRRKRTRAAGSRVRPAPSARPRSSQTPVKLNKAR
jgi:hypothetical protein